MERINNKTRRTQLITYADTHGCAVFLVARFKIGHTLRKLPVTQTATSRFIAYRADAWQVICSHSIRLVAVTQDILYNIASPLSSLFSWFFKIFSKNFCQFCQRGFQSTFPGVSYIFYSIFTKNSSQKSPIWTYFWKILRRIPMVVKMKHPASRIYYFQFLETIPKFIFRHEIRAFDFYIII